ncbi:3-isopropylmalate dehydratase large subunit [Ruminococcaceae bacterium OttesenSCG-928-O06]|nr:3-isopropylmalate dehydratase large subunit [Ruminococcaceae bacterium OttesenSCG-928-O06]
MFTPAAGGSAGPATLVEKILARNAGVPRVQPGQIITVRPTALMVHDIFVPFVAEKFAQMGFEKIWDANKVVLIYDHLVPAATADDVRHFQVGDAFAEKYGLAHVHRADGICHQLMVEQGYVCPGGVAFGTDSHTTTYGAVGAFATGIGYTEMAAVLGTGSLWVRVPPTIQVRVEGAFAPGVGAKDLILRLLGDIGADGAVYQALEFCGSAIEEMSLASRMVIANMAVEAGAKCAVFAPDGKALAFCDAADVPLEELRADEGAQYARVMEYDASTLEAVVACPSQVDKVVPVHAVAGTKVDQVFIGSCTNGRLEDLQIAADMLRGKQIAPYIRLIVTPASREVYGQAAKLGLLEDLIRAGATVTLPGCGLCCGRAGGILAGGEVVLATNNRNFMGRMGDATVQIYLASPAVAAATALAGEIALP